VTVSLRCEGCGWTAPRSGPLVFVCPHAGTDAADHVLAPTLAPAPEAWVPDDSDNPFLRYRRRLHAYAYARALGLSDAEYVDKVHALDQRVAEVDGRGFRVTRFGLEAGLADGAPVWVKHEHENVSGSHKGRHLFGVLLHLEFAAAAGLADPFAPLAIASCGNAALAAAVLARAAERTLDVYVPPDAHPRVVARLYALGATVHVCARTEGAAGDPTVAAFRAAVSRGAVPFACQGTDNGLTLDGGKTLGYELLDAGVALDRVFVQVGGGALASCVTRAFAEADAAGALPKMPRWMAVQGESVAPLAAAYRRLLQSLSARSCALAPDDPNALADFAAASPAREAALADLAAHRARYLRPWPTPAPSVAHGILDDEVYDGAAVLRAVVRSGGRVLTVDEATLTEAETRAGAAVDATGTAGLAGLLAWRRASPRGAETCAVLFTGARR
jgi:threonine synthase